MSQILIFGASGLIGSELTKLLRADGQQVRTVTGKPEKANGREIVYANPLTGQGIKEAFEGVDRAFLLSPSGYADQFAMLSPLITEAKRRGLKKVVLMTAMGANAVETAPLRRAELELERSGLTYNIIRPNWFLQNFNTFWIQSIKDKGQIQLPAGTAKTSFIDARDISAVAAKLLTTSEFDNQALDLSGLDSVDHAEVAQAISEVSGKKVTYNETQPEEFKANLLGHGLPADYVDFMALIIGFLREGYNAGLTQNVKKVLGREPISLKTYAQDYRKSF